MKEAISHCAHVTDLPESMTSLRDKEITHLSLSLPHSALSSPSRTHRAGGNYWGLKRRTGKLNGREGKRHSFK